VELESSQIDLKGEWGNSRVLGYLSLLCVTNGLCTSFVILMMASEMNSCFWPKTGVPLTGLGLECGEQIFLKKTKTIYGIINIYLDSVSSTMQNIGLWKKQYLFQHVCIVVCPITVYYYINMQSWPHGTSTHHISKIHKAVHFACNSVKVFIYFAL